MITTETWKTIYEEYEVSDLGRIRRKDTKRLLSTNKPDFLGYCRVTLKINGEYKTRTVHRIVAEAFLDRREWGTEVHHKNGDKTDNRAENLEWLSHREHSAKDKARRNGRPTKYHENWLARQKMSF